MIRFLTVAGSLLLLLPGGATTTLAVAEAAMHREVRAIEAPQTNTVVTLELSWFEKANRIVAESVCLDLGTEDKNYRLCRQRAQQLFQAECSQHQKQLAAAVMPIDPELRAALKKFCVAAETFVP
jgi:hypothetical protein